MQRASSGILKQKNDTRYELASFQELSILVHTPSSFEEVFVRRNALLLFLQRILRSAQVHNGSLRPAYPGSLTCCTCGECPDLEFCPLHDIFDEERAFLYPKLYEGDRVVKGPDWQWGNQGDCGEGTVLQIKDWKDQVNVGVLVLWDNGDENVYRYGADSSYDVVLVNPMMRDDYVPQGGYEEWSESRS